MHTSQLNTCSLFFCSDRIWSVGRSGGDWGGLHVLLHTGMWRVSSPSPRIAEVEVQGVLLTAQTCPFSLGFSQYNIFVRNIWSSDMDYKRNSPFIWTMAQVPVFNLLIPDYGFQNIIDVLISHLSIETWDNDLLTIDTGDKMCVSAIKMRCCFIVEEGALQQCKFMWSLIVSLSTFYFVQSSRKQEPCVEPV